MAETPADKPPIEPTEVQTGAANDSQAPAFDPVALLDQYAQVKGSPAIVDRATGAGASAAPQSGGKGCPASPDYDQYIDVAARHIYDPKDLGNITDLEHKYDCLIHSGADVFAYADKAFAVTGDRFVHAMPPDEVLAFEQMQSGRYSGIGMEIQPAKFSGLINPAAETVISSATPGKAAALAGLQGGDAIVKIDGKDVHKLGIDDVANLIGNGKPGTKVDIVVDRQGQPVERVVTREAVEGPPIVRDRDLGDGIAYIKIDHFGNTAEADQLAAAMDKYKNAKAFVIDVRDNPGGLISAALASAQLFVKDGVLMNIRQRLDSSPVKPVYEEETWSLNDKDAILRAKNSNTGQLETHAFGRIPYKAAGRPVVVLTNRDTASAAEIFVGAVHDSANDTVAGTTTYGKGIGQSVVKDMPDGGYLKVTSMRYTTPSGHWPGPGTGDKDHPEYGLKPDVTIPNPKHSDLGTASDAQLNGAVAILKIKLLR